MKKLEPQVQADVLVNEAFELISTRWGSNMAPASAFPARGQDRNHGVLVLTECSSTRRRPDSRDFGLPGVLRAVI